MPRDPEKSRARKRRYRERVKVAKYGADAAGRDMRGRHGSHATGARNAKWTSGRFITSGGYVAVRVDASSPHAWGAHPRVKYAYEHILVMEAHLGRPIAADEVVHHIDHNRTNNAIANLEVMTRSEHAKGHDEERGRDDLGRFPPADLRVREFPEAARA